MKGPPPDPARAKRRTGNRKATSERPGALAVAGARAGDLAVPIEPPLHLTEDARAVWRELAEDLANVQGVRQLDHFALENLANLIAQARRVAHEIGTGPVDAKRMAAYRNHVVAILRYAEQFALTPAARLRLGVKQLEGQTMAAQLAAALEGD